MPIKTYQPLDVLVKKMIEAYGGGPTDASLQTRFAPGLTAGFGQSPSLEARDLSDALQDLAEAVGSLVKPWIKDGLAVTAKTPPSSIVNIAKGTGIAYGKVFTITGAGGIDTVIPLDDKTYVWYVNLYQNGVNIDKQKYDYKVPVAKVVVPNPGKTVKIRDDAPTDGFDGWIVSGKDPLFDDGWEWDDATEAVLKNTLDKIFAQNIFGSIKLSENLTITNAQGTLKMDSNSVNIFYESGNLGSKFNRRGVFFYEDSSSATELAHFSSTDARIGNIVINTNSIQSGNFVTGNLGSGFQIKDDGDVEFQNATIRGRLKTTVFEKDTISVIGGTNLVMGGDILDADMTSSDTSQLVIKGDDTFAVGDILRGKDGFDDEWIAVDGVAGNTYIVSRDQGNGYAANNNPAWKKGTAITNYGKSGSGGIYLTSSESNSPYISVITHGGDPWNNLITKMRMGNLNGYLGYTTDEYGIAIGDSDSFLKYDPAFGMRLSGDLKILLGMKSQSYFRNVQGTGSGVYIEIGNEGIALKDGTQGSTYSSGQYSTAKYGYGALAYILNPTLQIPLAVLKEPKAGATDVADVRFYNRSDDPGGTAEKGDLACVNGHLVGCTANGSPGTWETYVHSDGTTGGSGSAGAGNQYIEVDINGTTYKLLHD